MLQVIAGTTVDIPYTGVEPDGTPAAAATISIRRMSDGYYWDDDAPGGAAWVVGVETNTMTAGSSAGNQFYAWAVSVDLPRGTRIRIECAATDCVSTCHCLTVLGALVADTDDLSDLQIHGDLTWPTADVAGIPAAVDALLSANHGSGLWGASGAANTATITVEDDDEVPVGSCPVRVSNLGGQLVGYGVTNASTGVVVFNLDDGDYLVTLGPIANYSPANPYAVEVDGDTEVTLSASPLSIPTATVPGACTVYANMLEANGLTPVAVGAGALTLVEVVSRPPDSTMVLADDANGDAPGETDAFGQARLANLPQGAVMRIRANWPDGRSKTVTVTVPEDEDTYDIGTLVQP